MAIASTAEVGISSIEEARERIAPYVKRTPLEFSHSLSDHLGTNVYVKYELFQKTGSFKVRGAFNRIRKVNQVRSQRTAGGGSG